MLNQTHAYRKSLWIVLFVFITVTCLELIAILLLNSGHLIFPLDDPYIHFALAENILNGHYGINKNEFSSASSSILWPFIIAPFAQFSFNVYAVLFMNMAATMGTIILFWKLLLPDQSNHCSATDGFEKTLTIILIISIPAVNLVGLMYTGMEHSVQLFFSILIIYGLTCEIEYKKVAWWFIVAIVIAPLIRYECFALSFPALLYLYIRGYRAQSIFIASLLLFLVGAFSVFLLSLGLDAIPTSIIAKLSVVSSEAGAGSFLLEFYKKLQSTRAILLIVGMSYLLYFTLNKEPKMGLRVMALVVFISAFLHLIGGKYGWYSRYEIYIWASVIITILYLNKNWIYQLPSKMGFYKMVGLMVFSLCMLCLPYIKVLMTIPLASNNIYEQQYQMHRFATKYNKPVAVNDLGYVSYKSNHYVLDLWGLASGEALKLRRHDRALRKSGQSNHSVNWMSEITQDKNIQFAMIYDELFHRVPQDWKRVGKLSLGKLKISPAYSSVSFYAIGGCKPYIEISHLMDEFRHTLPKGVTFESETDECINMRNN